MSRRKSGAHTSVSAKANFARYIHTFECIASSSCCSTHAQKRTTFQSLFLGCCFIHMLEELTHAEKTKQLTLQMHMLDSQRVLAYHRVATTHSTPFPLVINTSFIFPLRRQIGRYTRTPTRVNYHMTLEAGSQCLSSDIQSDQTHHYLPYSPYLVAR